MFFTLSDRFHVAVHHLSIESVRDNYPAGDIEST
jgi:hypothetical protein